MAYTALYRKFRPQVFSEVKGQDPIIKTLQNQIMGDRIGHAYLFCGTRGTGKTSVAKIFAKAVNCEHPVDGNPCGTCATCRAIADGSSLNVIEIDAASNSGVDNIREIRDEVNYSPTEGRFKVYIIDEAHQLSPAAFNALLKTLEEPPSYVIFILATTETRKIPQTILSRCQRFDFRRISGDTVQDRLIELLDREGIEAEPEAIAYLARQADGSMRDALSLTEQCISYFPDHKMTYERILDIMGAVDDVVFERLLQAIREGNAGSCIVLLDEILGEGRELEHIIADFIWYLRNLLLLKNTASVEEVIDVLNMSREKLLALKNLADQIETSQLFRLIRIFSELSGELKQSNQKRILAETTFIRVCHPESDVDLTALTERIRVLEEKLANGGGGKIVEKVIERVVEVPGEGVPAKPKPKTILPNAVPEEIRALLPDLRPILMSADPALEQFIGNTRFSLSKNGNLQVVCDGEATAAFLNSRKKTLEECLDEKTGKHIPFEITYVQKNSTFEQSFADLEACIKMPIEVED